jgi:hypothetical protein
MIMALAHNRNHRPGRSSFGRVGSCKKRFRSVGKDFVVRRSNKSNQYVQLRKKVTIMASKMEYFGAVSIQQIDATTFIKSHISNLLNKRYDSR